MKNKCMTPGCDKKIAGWKTYCSTHYSEFQSYLHESDLTLKDIHRNSRKGDHAFYFEEMYEEELDYEEESPWDGIILWGC